MADGTGDPLLTMTGDIVAAHVANNHVSAGDLPILIKSIYDALSLLGAPTPPPQAAKPQGAVSARKSLASADHLVSMIDGKPYRLLRRHISRHGYTPESYRAAFGLPSDYPMSAPNYTAIRREIAHKTGLGRKPRAERPPAATPANTPPRRGRKPKTIGESLSAAKEHLGGK